MKRILALLVIVAAVLVTACGGSETAAVSEAADVDTVVVYRSPT